MINFFRRIRQNLLGEGKLKKYLIYAIGEILLVMIGILLALQVNNWNENRNSLSAQNEALHNLKTDLSHDIDRFNALDSIYNTWMEQCKYILEEILDGSTEKLNHREDYLIGRGSMNYLTLRNNTFDEMINTGIFYKIKDKSLSEAILEYYDLANFEIEKVNQDNKDFYNYMLNELAGEPMNILVRLIEKRNLEFIDWSWLKDPKSIEYKELETRVIWFRDTILGNKLVIKSLREKAIFALNVINNQ